MLVPSAEGDSGGYQVRFPLPLDMQEAREELLEVRAGLSRLISRFEPDRFRAMDRLVSTFGQRETLAQLNLRQPPFRATPVQSPGVATVH